MGDIVYFRNDSNASTYERFFHALLRSYGKPRCDIVAEIVDSMMVFFINNFLTMTCLSIYNETNLNRLFINYSPTLSERVDDAHIYAINKQFRNLYLAKSHLTKWNSYECLMTVLDRKVSLTVISLADIVVTIIYLNAMGAMKINPVYYKQVLRGEPFYVKGIISQYWFLTGLKYRDVYELKFRQTDAFEERKKQYMKATVVVKQRSK